MDARDSHASGEDLVELRLVEERGVLGLDGLQLDAYLSTGFNAGPNVDIAKGT